MSEEAQARKVHDSAEQTAATGLAVTPLEKLDAVRQWVATGIEETLVFDPSGFALGVESVTILEALDDIEEALRG